MGDFMRILMVENDAGEVLRYANVIGATDDARLIASTGSADEAIRLVSKMLPDIVLLDIELDEGDGLNFLYELEDISLPHKPFILVITWTTVKSVLQNAIDHGVGHIQPKSAPKYDTDGPEIVLRYLRRMRPYFHFDDCPTREATENILQPTPLKLKDAAEEAYWKDEISKEIGLIGITSGTMSISLNQFISQPKTSAYWSI